MKPKKFIGVNQIHYFQKEKGYGGKDSDIENYYSFLIK